MTWQAAIFSMPIRARARRADARSAAEPIMLNGLPHGSSQPRYVVKGSLSSNAQSGDQVLGRKGVALAEIDHPLPRSCAGGKLGDGARRGQLVVRRPRTLAISRCDIRVVAGKGIESGDETVDEGILVHEQRRVLGALMARVRRVRRANRESCSAQTAEPVGGKDRRRIRELLRKLPGGAMLQVAQTVGDPRAGEVGATHGPEEHRATCERRDRTAAFLEDVRHVRRCVTGGVAGHEAECPELDLLAIGDGAARVADRLARRDDQRRPGEPAELTRPGDVVVMDMGFDHMAQAGSPVGEQFEHPIEVPLGVHHHCFAAGNDRVASIAQLWGLDGEDLRGHV